MLYNTNGEWYWFVQWYKISHSVKDQHSIHLGSPLLNRTPIFHLMQNIMPLHDLPFAICIPFRTTLGKPSIMKGIICAVSNLNCTSTMRKDKSYLDWFFLRYVCHVWEDECLIDIKAECDDVLGILMGQLVGLLSLQILPQELLIIGQLDDQGYVEHFLQPPMEEEIWAMWDICWWAVMGIKTIVYMEEEGIWAMWDIWWNKP